MSKLTKALSQVPEEGSISEDYFYRMLSPQALQIAHPFIKEEHCHLEDFLLSNTYTKDMNLISIGGGELTHYDLADKLCKSYVCIEPLIHIFTSYNVRYLIRKFENIHLIQKKLSEVEIEEIPTGNSIFVFTFNIISYIKNPIRIINNYIKEGDILFITTWNQNQKSQSLRKEYFDFLNKFEDKIIIDPEKTTGLCNLDNFPFEKMSHYKKHLRIKDKHVDTLIVFC